MSAALHRAALVALVASVPEVGRVDRKSVV